MPDFLDFETYLTINRILLFVMVPLSLFIGGWVYLNNKKERLNQLFFLLSISIISFPTFAHLTFFATQPDISLFWVKWAYASGTWFLIVFFFFFIYFFREEMKFKPLQIFVITGGIFIIFMSFFTNLIVKEIEIQEIGVRPFFGPGAYLFYIFSFIIFIFIFYRFYKNYIIASREEKTKIQYFFVGTLIFILLNTFFNIILPIFRGTFELHQFGNYAGIILLGLTAYAITKRELFGVRLILTTLLVAIIAILLAADLVLLTQKLSFQIIKGFTLILFLYFGYFLIKSVIREIQRRAEIQKLYQELEKLDEAKTEFMSIVSHQLRTPLTAIKGYTSMILEGIYGKLPEKMQKPVDNVLISSERLIRFVNDILNVTRIETGRLEFIPESTAMEEIISSVIFELDIKAKEKNLYLKWEKPKEPLPKIMIDPDKTRQVILNFIDNAIKYTNEGGVTVEVGSTKSEVRIKISDTGVGMSKEDIAKLFKSFSRGESGVTYYKEGTGLGLYIARQFVEMQRGRTWAESPGKGKGSTFYIELPMK